MNAETTPRKQCSDCKDWKPITDFHKEKKKKLGVQSKCKFCKRQEGFSRRAAVAEAPANCNNNEEGGAHAQQKEEDESDEGIPAQ